MDSVNTQAASKPSLYYRKTNSSQDSWEGGEELLSIVLERFLSLKSWGYQCGVQKDVVFSHWP